MKKDKRTIELFLYFLKIGWYTFGGGWSILAQIQNDYVEKKHYITDEELLDITSIGKSLPGVMVGNVTIIFGYHVAGISGALVSLLGMSIPPITILTIVTFIYTSFRDNPYVNSALMGVRACVVPIIISATIRLFPAALKKWYTYIIFGLAIVAMLFTNINPILLVFIGAVIGIAFSLMTERRNKTDETVV